MNRITELDLKVDELTTELEVLVQTIYDYIA